MSDLFIYILMAIIVVVDIYFYFENLWFSPDSTYQINKRNLNIINESGYKYDLYNRFAVVDVPNLLTIEIKDSINNTNINEIDIDRKISCDRFIIGKNILLITKLDLSCNELISYSKDYIVKDDMLFDKFNNVVLIYKQKSREELFEIAHKYSIRRDALRYFTNALYYQFVFYKGLFDIRYSKPYYDKNEDLWAIVPTKVNEKTISSISINYSNVDYLYLGKDIERVIIEKKSSFNNLVIDKENKFLTIYNNSLLDKENLIFINDGFNTFNKNGMKNQNDFKAKYKKLNHKLLSFKTKLTYNVICEWFANNDK